MCRKPRLPNVWLDDLDNSLLLRQLRLPVLRQSGQGFIYKIPGSLPDAARSTFVELSVVDTMLSTRRQQWSDTPGFQALLRTRNGLHHAVLSIPPWDDLDPEEKHSTHSTTYEACRLTAIIYSNSVLMGFPNNTGWHKIHLKRLRMVITLSDAHNHGHNMSEFLVWVSFVAGIAAYQLPEFAFFVEVLRKTCVSLGVKKLADARSILRDFIWSDDACLTGATILWNYVERSAPNIDTG
jgi:hypothetical protein